jgi:hypothetical protein
MAARLTVVLDDEEIYRAAKIRAAEQGMPLKTLIESALRQYLSGAPADVPEIEWDWAAYEDWQREVEALDREAGELGPDDLSDVKHQLYGYPRRPLRMLAEERAPYGDR